LKNVPLCVFHCGKDNGLENENQCVAGLRAIGSDVKHTVYPDLHHDACTKTYSNPELYAWFLQHQLTEKSERHRAKLIVLRFPDPSW
jgi:hypothetical protein